MFGGGFGKQIAADIVSQIQQLRADVMTEFHKGRVQEHGDTAQSEAAHIDAHRFSLSPVTIPIFHLIVDCFNILGVMVILFCTLGILPTLLFDVFPQTFFLSRGAHVHGKVLECRMALSRGLILGMDLMVASDVVETLCGQVNLVRLLVIVAVRSWLGYERNKEMSHMSHEYKSWKKAHDAISSHLGDVTKVNLAAKISQTFEKLDLDKNGQMDVEELSKALRMVGISVNSDEMSDIIPGDSKGLTRAKFTKLVCSMPYVKSLATEEELSKIVDAAAESEGSSQNYY